MSAVGDKPEACSIWKPCWLVMRRRQLRCIHDAGLLRWTSEVIVSIIELECSNEVKPQLPTSKAESQESEWPSTSEYKSPARSRGRS